MYIHKCVHTYLWLPAAYKTTGQNVPYCVICSREVAEGEFWKQTMKIFNRPEYLLLTTYVKKKNLSSFHIQAREDRVAHRSNEDGLRSEFAFNVFHRVHLCDNEHFFGAQSMHVLYATNVRPALI